LGALVATFPVMEVRTSSNTAQMMTIFIWFGVGTAGGVMIVNPLFDRVHGMLLLSILSTLMAVFAGLAPTWTSLAAFQVLASLLMTVCGIMLAGKFANRLCYHNTFTALTWCLQETQHTVGWEPSKRIRLVSV